MDANERVGKSPFLDKGEYETQTDSRPPSHFDESKPKKPNIFQYLFGCCLEREASNEQEQAREENGIQSVASGKSVMHTPYTESNGKQTESVDRLQFNHRQKSEQQYDSGGHKKNQEEARMNINGEVFTFSQASLTSGVYQQSHIDARSSTLSLKTHNYDFDVSNYLINQLFLCGKILQIITLVKEVRNTIDYTALLLPDDFRPISNLTSSSCSTSQDQICSSYQFHLDTIKYYRRRQVYSSKHCSSIVVDSRCWQYLVPECIVQHIASRIAISSKRESIIDAFSGSSQFSIAFAAQINTVIAIETDPALLVCARQNSTTYNVPHFTYGQSNRLSLTEGILFFEEGDFLSDIFSNETNLADCVFLAPQLSLDNLNAIPSREDSYYSSADFYKELRKYLSKAFKLAPQVVLFTPRTIKVVEIIDCFTDAMKENPNTAKRCSIEIEKHFVNNHLKYVCFYFGDFNKTQLSAKEEFHYINLQLEKCQPPVRQGNIVRRKPVRIHQWVFNELGKFQLLNVVCKFNFHIKLEKPLREDNSLLSLFYAYLVSHGFLTQERVQYILSRSRNGNSTISSSTNMNLNTIMEEIKPGNNQIEGYRISSDEKPSQNIPKDPGLSVIQAPNRGSKKQDNNRQSYGIEGEDQTLSSISRITMGERRKKSWRRKRESSENQRQQRAHSEGENNEECKEEDQLYSETETGSVYDQYENDSSFSKTPLNISANTNQISFLHQTQRIYESKLEDNTGDRTRGAQKSQLSNWSHPTAVGDQDQQIIFNQQFFFDPQKKENSSYKSFNFLNSSELKDNNTKFNSFHPSTYSNQSKLPSRAPSNRTQSNRTASNIPSRASSSLASRNGSSQTNIPLNVALQTYKDKQL